MTIIRLFLSVFLIISLGLGGLTGCAVMPNRVIVDSPGVVVAPYEVYPPVTVYVPVIPWYYPIIPRFHFYSHYHGRHNYRSGGYHYRRR